LIAFSPGSITLFFSIRDRHRDVIRKGSLGVGMVIDKGAITKVEKSTQIEVSVNGRKMDNTIQESMLRMTGIRARITTETHLPIAQGFGMSAAAAVSTSLSLFYGERSFYECIYLAHRAEIEKGSGLGDVASISRGGFTIRLREGIPPYGFIDKLMIERDEFVILWLDEPIETKSVIREQEFRKRIIKAGDEAMEHFLRERTLRNAFRVARRFSRQVSLAGPQLNEIMEKALNFGEVSQIMIGNSLIAYGDNNSLEKLFEGYGNVMRIKIYDSGPGLIKENI